MPITIRLEGKKNMLFKKKKKKEKIKSQTRKPRFTRKIKIGGKYLFAFSISSLLFVCATVLVFLQLSASKSDVKDIIEQNQVKSDLVQMALYIEQQGGLVSDFILINNIKYVSEFNEIDEDLLVLSERLSNSLSTEQLQYFDKVVDGTEFIRTSFADTITNDAVDDSDKIYAQIQINSHKSTSNSYMKLLINEIEEEEQVAITQVNTSMDYSIVILIVANIISVATGLIIMIVISRRISSHLHNVVSTAIDISKGHLSTKPIDYEGKDEIGQLSHAINTLQLNMRDIIQNVASASEDVSIRSEQLKQSSSEVKEGSEQMVITMDELATGAETQANQATQLSEQMTEFVISVQFSQQQGQEIAQTSNDIIHLTEGGAELMKQSISQMEHIDTIVRSAVTQVRGLDEQSDAITKLIEVVKNIAGQTNLLALNAAIEAARAGEHGKGFAVVADEVRKLAEQVTSSVTEITSIVHHIQHETNTVATSLDNGYKEVKTGIDQVEQTGASFATIETSISNMAEGINDIAERLQRITEHSEQVNQSIESIAAVSEEAAAGVEESSASTQEASSSMDEVSDSADELASLADQLKAHINTFKL